MEVRGGKSWQACFFIATAFSIIACASAYSADVDALLAVRDALGGPDRAFATWNPATNPCNGTTPWVGVTCTRGRVTGLTLVNQTLDGTLSPSVAALTELSTLVLNYNRIGGVLPNVFGNMTRLQFLNLSRNRFIGPIPPSIGSAGNLSTLLLSNNNFNTSIPIALANLRRLQTANVSNNDLHGGLAPALLSLPALQILDVSGNSLTGFLPNATSATLVFLDVGNNQLSGTIPASLLAGNFTFQYTGNPGLRLPTDLAPAPAPAPGFAPVPAPQAPVRAPTAVNASVSASTSVNGSASAPTAVNGSASALTAVNGSASAPTAVNGSASAPTAVNGSASAPTAVSATPNVTPPFTLPLQSAPAPLNASTANGTAGGGAASSSVTTPGGSGTPEGALISSKDSGGSNTGLIVGATIGCAVAVGIIAAVLLALLAIRKRKRTRPMSYLPTNSKDSWHSFPDTRSGPLSLGTARVFPLPVLSRGTHGFAESQQVGTGLGSKVYLATLPNGDPALVKRRHPAIAGFQSKSEFEKEVAELSRLSHRNLVPLAGCCVDDRERILIFSAPSTTSLRDYLHRSGVNTPQEPLDWTARLEIASGITAALAYLHSKSGPPRLYEELASTSVLVDEDLRPRLADFHLEGGGDFADSPLSGSGGGGSEYRRTPDRRRTGDWSSAAEKAVPADVYNFGVILLEMITGRPPFTPNAPVDERYLVNWVPPLLSIRDFDSVLDARLKGDCTDLSLTGFADLAQDCLNDQAMARPSLSEVQQRIDRCLSLQRNERAGSQVRGGLSSREKGGWEEEDEYEVRDLPDGAPVIVGRPLGAPAWDPPSSAGSDSASYHSFQ